MEPSFRQSGFTLAETAVTLAILAMLAAGAVWMLGTHPGSVMRATDDFDAALASARAIAATSGNGATLAFLPRGGPSHAFAGFTAARLSRPSHRDRRRAPGNGDAGGFRRRHFREDAGNAAVLTLFRRFGRRQWIE